MNEVLYPARLVGREDAGGGLVLVILAVPARARQSYVRPGQYVSTRIGAATSHFVLANEVGAARWQLLIRPRGAAADAMISLAPNDEFEITQALGDGFPVAEARTRTLLLAATGSGIAAMRSVIHDRIVSGDAPRTWLYIGVPTRSEVPIESEVERWHHAGVFVTACLSRDTPPAGDARFAKGYVQDVAARNWSTDVANAKGALIFAAGVTQMIAGMRRLARELGMAETDVSTNF